MINISQRSGSILNWGFFVMGLLFGLVDIDVFLAEDNFFAHFSFFDTITIANYFKYFFFVLFSLVGIFYFLKNGLTKNLKIMSLFLLGFILVSEYRLFADNYNFITAFLPFEIRHLMIFMFVAIWVIYGCQDKSFTYFIKGFMVITVGRAAGSVVWYFILGGGFVKIGELRTIAWDGSFLQEILVSVFFLIYFYLKAESKQVAVKLFYLISTVIVILVIGASFRRFFILKLVTISMAAIVLSLFLQKEALDAKRVLKIFSAITLFIGISLATLIQVFTWDTLVDRVKSLSFEQQLNELAMSNDIYVDDWFTQFDLLRDNGLKGIGFKNRYNVIRMIDYIVGKDAEEEIGLHTGFYEIIVRMGILGGVLQLLIFLLYPGKCIIDLRGKCNYADAFAASAAISYILYSGLFPFGPNLLCDIKTCFFVGISIGFLEMLIANSVTSLPTAKSVQPVAN